MIILVFVPRSINREVSGGVICFREALTEPIVKRTYAFFDGQNLYHSAKEAFGYTFPNYDPLALASSICDHQGWKLNKVFFYTGIPSIRDNPNWSTFWTKKKAVMGTRGISVFSRELRYQNKVIRLKDGSQASVLMGQEKGIDVRIALDVIRFTLDRSLDVALIFSQDQDLSEVADEIRRIARIQARWIKIASVSPSAQRALAKEG